MCERVTYGDMVIYLINIGVQPLGSVIYRVRLAH